MKKPGKESRAEKAGRKLGEQIVEVSNLMYQKNTKENFLHGAMKTVDDEWYKIVAERVKQEKQKK